MEEFQSLFPVQGVDFRSIPFPFGGRPSTVKQPRVVRELETYVRFHQGAEPGN